MRRQVAARADGIDLTIAGAMHPDFTDDLYDPERWMLWRPWRGRPIAPIRMRAIVDAYVIAFFDQHLKGVIQPLLRNSRSPFAEVSLARGTGKP